MSVPPLLDFIPQITPGHSAPVHLKPVTDAFERIAAHERVELAFSVPPRHGKTETLLHGVMWLFRQKPGLKVAYLTHSHDYAIDLSLNAQRIAKRAGFSEGQRWTVQEWETDNGCTFKASSLLGSIVGRGFNVIVIDDPYPKREMAESANFRKKLSDSFRADVYTRQMPGEPTSFVVLHTRWHPDDLIAELTHPDAAGGRPFKYINLPAISDDGKALWPEGWPVEELALQRAKVSDYEWASQYQGRPVHRGAQVFSQPTTCLIADVPNAGRYSIGVDLAYTAKTHADYSVSLVLSQHGDTFYVVDVQRRQVQAPDFAGVLRSHASRYAGAPMTWHCAGVEKGAAQFLQQSLPLNAIATTQDKFVRAQDVSAAWNSGKILVPSDASWSAAFLDELAAFTGVGDLHDDQVDALSSAFGALKQSAQQPRYTSVKSRDTKGWGRHY